MKLLASRSAIYCWLHAHEDERPPCPFRGLPAIRQRDAHYAEFPARIIPLDDLCRGMSDIWLPRRRAMLEVRNDAPQKDFENAADGKLSATSWRKII